MFNFKILFLLLLLVFSNCIFKKQDFIIHNTNSYSWDFGEVKEGKILRYNFILKNNSSKTLNIKDAHTSCGCTILNLNKKTLLPKEEAIIETEFDTKGISGDIEQHIYLYTDNSDQQIIKFTIKGRVIP